MESSANSKRVVVVVWRNRNRDLLVGEKAECNKLHRAEGADLLAFSGRNSFPPARG